MYAGCSSYDISMTVLHTDNRLFFVFLSLWIYLWLAETSQQPISQTTWLKVTPHCNHCNHFLSELMDLFVTGRHQSAADQPNNLAEGHPPL